MNKNNICTYVQYHCEGQKSKWNEQTFRWGGGGVQCIEHLDVLNCNMLFSFLFTKKWQLSIFS